MTTGAFFKDYTITKSRRNAAETLLWLSTSLVVVVVVVIVVVMAVRVVTPALSFRLRQPRLCYRAGRAL